MSVDTRPVGIFGGSFNPPHIGHVLACHFALSVWNLQRVIVVPSFQHPFGKRLEPFEHRMEMVKQAMAHLGANVEVSNVEHELGGVSYTVETLRELRCRLPDAQLRLVIGSDIVEESAKWHRFDEIRELAPLLVIPRLTAGGSQGQGCYLPNVSSTYIRDTLATGGDPRLSLPASVFSYIKANQLYGYRLI